MILRIVALSASILLMTVGASQAESHSDSSGSYVVLEQLKMECDVPGQSHESTWATYLSPTEESRLRCLKLLKKDQEAALAIIRKQRPFAHDEYKDMLTVALAALGDERAVIESAKLMIDSRYPAVRVCAAWELCRLKDERKEGFFRELLLDSYSRKDTTCMPSPSGRVYPLRILAIESLKLDDAEKRIFVFY